MKLEGDYNIIPKTMGFNRSIWSKLHYNNNNNFI